MPNFSAESAAEAGEFDDGPTLQQLVTHAVTILHRLQQEIQNRDILDGSADDAEDVVPSEMRFFVEFNGGTFRIAARHMAEKFNVTSLAPLVEPIRMTAAEDVIGLVDDLAAAVQDLYQLCHPELAEAPEDARPSTPSAPDGLLDALKARGDRAARPDAGA
jgi:hypothetical protein